MTTEGLRERKKRETRLRIHACALDLAEHRGLAQVTTDEIAEAAGISPRTFFNYFATKDASVIGADPELGDAIAASILAQPADASPLDCLEAAFAEHALPGVLGAGVKAQRWRVLEANPHLLPVMLGVGRSLEGQAADALADRLGLDRDDPYPPLVAAAAYATVRVALEHHRRGGLEMREAVRLGFATLRAGLAPPRR